MTVQGGPVDIHSHLVPDVDDGARGTDGSLAAIGRMVEVGVRRILTTPHLDASLQSEEAELAERVDEVESAFQELRTAAAEAHPEVELQRGFEVNLDYPEVDFSDTRLRLAGTRFALVEWPRLQIPPETTRVIERIVATGTVPVIAHPERYGGIEQMGDIPRHWVEAGALLQVNWGSLVGRYGAAARRIATRLLRVGAVSYLASDFHGREHLALNYLESREALEGLGGAETFRVLTETNPRRLLEDEMPMPAPILPESDGFLAKVRRMIGGRR